MALTVIAALGATLGTAPAGAGTGDADGAAGPIEAPDLPPLPGRPVSLEANAHGNLGDQAILLGERVADVVFDTVRSVAYASLPNSRRIVVFDPSWNIVDEIPTGAGANPEGLDLLSGGDTLVAAIHGTGEVAEIDLESRTITRRIDLAELLGDDRTYDVREIDPRILLVTAAPGSSGLAHVVRVDLDDVDEAARVASDRFIRARPRIWANRGAGFALVGEGFSPPSLYRLDTTDPAAPLVDEDHHGDISGPTNAALHPDNSVLLTRTGQVIGTHDLEVIADLPNGHPAITADGATFYLADTDAATGLVHVIDADTLTTTRSFTTSCATYPEFGDFNEGKLDPDERHLVLLGDQGICLEPTDGSGRLITTLEVSAQGASGRFPLDTKVAIVDQDGEIVHEIEEARRTHRITLREGEYWVLSYHAVGNSRIDAFSWWVDWPHFATWHDGSPLLSRGPIAPLVVEGPTRITITASPLFYDLRDSSDALFEAIVWMQATGITQGCDLVHFCPGLSVTRGEMAAFFNRAFALPNAGPTGLLDEAGTFAQDIRNLYASGITRGCTVVLFCTSEPVSRGAMAAFLNRALGLPDAGPTGLLDEAGTFAQDIRNLYASGITRGCSTVLFCTWDAVDRQEMALFMYRALEPVWPNVPKPQPE